MMNDNQELDELHRAHERLETQVNAVLPTLATKTELNDGLASVRAEMRAGFEQVDQRFDKMDQRFDRMDQRFDNMNRRLDRLLYILIAGLFTALLSVLGMLPSRPPAAPSAAPAAYLPPGTIIVTLPATPQVAAKPQP